MQNFCIETPPRIAMSNLKTPPRIAMSNLKEICLLILDGVRHRRDFRIAETFAIAEGVRD